MGTIPLLPPFTPPLAGTELVIIDDGTTTDKAAVDVISARAELLTCVDLGARPERLDAAGTYFTTQGAGDPLAVWFPPTIGTLAGYGYVDQNTGGSTLWTRPTVPANPTRVYEVEAEVEQVSVGGGESPVARLGIRSLKSDFTDTVGTPSVWAAPGAVFAAADIQVLTARFGAVKPYGGAAWANPATAIFLRPFVEFGVKSDLTGMTTTSVQRVRRLLIRDVTDTVLAEQRARRQRRFFRGEL